MSLNQLWFGVRVHSVLRYFSVVALSVLVGGLAGCSQSTNSGSSSTTTASAKPLSADQVLRDMIDAYQSADAYYDNAVVRLSYKRDGREFADEAPLSVSWKRPNRIVVQAYQVEVACDGARFRAKISDQSTGDFDGQVVDRAAPKQLLPRQFFEDDQVLGLALRQGLAGNPIQLDLLLSEEPLSVLFEKDVTRRMLLSTKVAGRDCYRVAVDSDDGRFVFVVDKKDFVLRRMEYPADTFAPEVAQDTEVAELALTVECHDAALNGELAGETFGMRIARNAKKVSQFIPPPRELPSKLFGTKAVPFSFKDLAGASVSNVSLKERVKVFVWFSNHAACQSTIQQLNQVFRQYQDESGVALFGVCVEPSSFTNQQIEQLTDTWRVDVPIVRDLSAVGRDLFRIPWAPTMVVLDAENTVQIVEIGANPNLVAELPQVLERLLAGEDLAKEILDQHKAQKDAYARALKQGKPLKDDTAAASGSQQEYDPQLLKLHPLWTNSQLKSPGNILAVRDDKGSARFLVLEGSQTIAELDSKGDVKCRHTLDVAEQDGVSQLKTNVDANGARYFVGWSLRGRQVHLFDAQWERLLSYPADAMESTGVQDVTLADLDRDGELELCVGFWGDGGVHCVSFNGKVHWTSNEVSHVFSLMTTNAGDGTPNLQVATAGGTIHSFDYLGRSELRANQSGQLIHHVFSYQSGHASEAPYCGISYGPEGRRLAVGLTDKFEPRWRYNLPAGSFPSQIRFVTAANLFADSSDFWLIAAPDGSLHVISRDGRFTDYFRTGTELVGVAGGRVDSKSLLLLSSKQGVKAFQVTSPTTAKAGSSDTETH